MIQSSVVLAMHQDRILPVGEFLQRTAQLPSQVMGFPSRAHSLLPHHKCDAILLPHFVLFQKVGPERNLRLLRKPQFTEGFSQELRVDLVSGKECQDGLSVRQASQGIGLVADVRESPTVDRSALSRIPARSSLEATLVYSDDDPLPAIGEADHGDVLDTAAQLARRIPATGRLTLLFDSITFQPFGGLFKRARIESSVASGLSAGRFTFGSALTLQPEPQPFNVPGADRDVLPVLIVAVELHDHSADARFEREEPGRGSQPLPVYENLRAGWARGDIQERFSLFRCLDVCPDSG